uniref:Transmembrane p24 trafficking protein 4 n=1 Tax=Astyanax mexicanus TaxID=7994 RepID=A0A8B9HAH1_ASTMX
MTAVVVCAAGLLLLFAWFSPSRALYFHIGETEKKCFIEEIPDETMVIGISQSQHSTLPTPPFYPTQPITLPNSPFSLTQHFPQPHPFIKNITLPKERFRMTSESTNQRVLWWSIAQTIILITAAIWQMRHLKSFFEAKKLV